MSQPPTAADRSAGLAIVLLFLAFKPVLGQTIYGTIRAADTDQPIINAAVILTDVSTQVETSVLSDGYGRFTLRPRTVGDYRIRVQRSGFSTFFLESFSVGEEGISGLDIRLRKAPVQLSGVVVRAPNANRAAFEERSRLRNGTKLDAADLARRGSRSLSTFVSNMDPFVKPNPRGPGIVMMGRNTRGFVAARSFFRRHFGGPGCSAGTLLFIDGKHVERGDQPLELEYFVDPHRVVAVEVWYPNELPSSWFVPARLASGGCEPNGLIALWTAEGFGEGPEPGGSTIGGPAIP